VVTARSQRHEPPEDFGGKRVGLALQPLLDLLLVLSEQGSPARGVSALLLGFRQRLALLTQQLQVPQEPVERALLLAGLLRIHRPCHGSLLLIFLPGREAGQGSLATTNRFQQGHRIAVALQFLQRLPLGIPELAKRQQPFLWCTGRMAPPLELGALADRLL
jgi:hypothetical protein